MTKGRRVQTSTLVRESLNEGHPSDQLYSGTMRVAVPDLATGRPAVRDFDLAFWLGWSWNPLQVTNERTPRGNAPR